MDSMEPPNHGASEELIAQRRKLAERKYQHRELDLEIQRLEANPWSDQFLIRRLKKQKLQLKERIELLKDEMIPDLDA